MSLLPFKLGGVARWALAASVTYVLVALGFTFLALPSYELTYKLRDPIANCRQRIRWTLELRQQESFLERNCAVTGLCARCWTHFSLEVTNTGIRAMPEVAIQLDRETEQDAIAGPQFGTFNQIGRRARRIEGDEVSNYLIGPMRQTESVTMGIFFRDDETEQPPEWDAVLVAINSPFGEARAGSASLTLLGRILVNGLSLGFVGHVENLIQFVFGGESEWDEAELIREEHLH